MPKTFYSEQKKQEIVSFINQEIDKLTADQMVLTSKLPQAKMDEKMIRERSRHELSNNLKKEVGAHLDEMLSFIEDLKREEPSLLMFPTSESIKIPDKLSWKQLQEIEIPQLPDNKKEELYQKGVQLFEAKQFLQAEKIFEILLSFDPVNPNVWFAKGLAEQCSDKLYEALYAYSQAIEIAPHFLIPYLQTLECLVLLKNKEMASQLYELFIKETKPSDYPDKELFQNKLGFIKNYLEAA